MNTPPAGAADQDRAPAIPRNPIAAAQAAALRDKAVIAVIALDPLPGSPGYAGDQRRILDRALSDLDHYAQANVTAVLIENSYDLPYVKPPLPADAVTLTAEIAGRVRERFPGPIGIQMLEAANTSALEIAADTGLDFVRVEGYVFAHVGGAGIIEGCAGQLHRRRKQLGCEHVLLLADVKKKHCAHALTGDLDIADVVRQAEFFLADGIVVTGKATGEPPTLEDLQLARGAASLPVFIGSGATPENLADLSPQCDGVIVGSALRDGGRFRHRLDPDRLRRFMEAWHALTGGG